MPLHDRLESVLDHPVTLLTAPAGFGKTWLVADWMASHADVAQCWLALDQYDNDPARLWLHLLRGVDSSGSPRVATEALRLLETTSAGVNAIVDALSVGLAEHAEEVVIVLDDVHRIDNDEALASLDRFLRQLPTTTHVVLLGRHDPALPLSRWRLSGDLLEIRTADLRCSLEESKAIVAGSLGLDLDAAVVAEIQHKTMGWLAGIRLAALATAASDDVSMAAAQLPSVGTVNGAYDTISDYLVEEVIDHLDEPDRRFLLDTSILRDLSGPLCAAVAGVDNSTETLERLARAEMFVSRIGETDVWYRYHDLFRDVLRMVLRRTAPKREKLLHRRAADWLHDEGSTVSAVWHALAAGDPDLAARWLIESSRPLLASKQLDTMCTLFEQIDDAPTPISAVALTTWIFPALFANTGPQIDRILDRARAGLAAMTDAEAELHADQWAQIPYVFHGSRAELLRGIDATRAHRNGDTALAAATLADQGSTPSESGWIEGCAGQYLIYTDRYAEGSTLLRAWFDYSFSAYNPIVGNTAGVAAMLAYAKLGTGDLAAAEAMANRGIEAMRVAGLGDQPHAAVATVPLAWVALERGDLDTAEALVAPVVGRLRDLGEVPAYVYAETLLARIHHYQGNPDKANVTLDRALVLLSGRTVTGHFADYVAFERCRLALINDDLASAQLAIPDWQQRIGHGAATMTEHLILTRLAIANQHDPTKLLENTPDGIDVTSTHQIELRKLNAYHALQNGDETTALDYLIKAMEIATHTGHRQTFLDDYPTFGALIENAAAMSGFRLTYPGRQPQTPPSATTAPTLTEPLTDRELEFLRLLPTHLTYKEIGEQLYVSTNTVKSYLKNIYRKLEVDNRNTAVAHAQTLGLLN